MHKQHLKKSRPTRSTSNFRVAVQERIALSKPILRAVSRQGRLLEGVMVPHPSTPPKAAVPSSPPSCVVRGAPESASTLGVTSAGATRAVCSPRRSPCVMSREPSVAGEASVAVASPSQFGASVHAASGAPALLEGACMPPPSPDKTWDAVGIPPAPAAV